MERPSFNRETNYIIDVDFNIEGYMFEDSVFIPTSIFKQALKKYLNTKGFDIHGDEEAIYRFFNEEGLLDTFGYNDDFEDICKELYHGSKEEQEDIEYFKWLYSDEIDAASAEPYIIEEE